MFGGFAEALAYHTPPNNELHSSTLDLKSLQGTLFSASNAALSDIREDFILIAECNEQHGPTPLVIIPNTVMVHSEEISTLAISLLSVDYQHVASGSFPRADTQILLPEIRDNLHVLVNYTVLLDSKVGFKTSKCMRRKRRPHTPLYRLYCVQNRRHLNKLERRKRVVTNVEILFHPPGTRVCASPVHSVRFSQQAQTTQSNWQST